MSTTFDIIESLMMDYWDERPIYENCYISAPICGIYALYTSFETQELSPSENISKILSYIFNIALSFNFMSKNGKTLVDFHHYCSESYKISTTAYGPCADRAV